MSTRPDSSLTPVPVDASEDSRPAPIEIPIPLSRDFAADVQRAFPDAALESFEVIGITMQSDSDDSRGETRVRLDYLTFRPVAR